VSHVVHGNIVGRARASVLAVDGESGRVRIAGQVVEHGQRGAGGRDFRIHRHAEAPRHGHGLDHLGHGFLNRILGLVRRRAGKADALRDAANRGNQPVDLVPHQKTAVTGLRPLSVLDFNGAGVFLHLRQVVDDFIPAEIAAGDLQDDVFQKARLEQPGRAAALAGADTDRHAHLLVQIRHAHLQTFPHVRGERAKRHAADDHRINLANGRHPAVFTAGLEHPLRRQDSSQQGPQLKFMSSGVERRVGQHGNADKLDLVEHAFRSVSPAAPSPRFAALVDVKAQFVGFIGAQGDDGVVGADQRTHAAAHAGMGRIGALIDAVVHGKQIGGTALQTDRRRERAFAVDAQFDGPHRADGCATAAQGTPILLPGNLPGQVFGA